MQRPYFRTIRRLARSKGYQITTSILIKQLKCLLADKKPFSRISHPPCTTNNEKNILNTFIARLQAQKKADKKAHLHGIYPPQIAKRNGA